MKTRRKFIQQAALATTALSWNTASLTQASPLLTPPAQESFRLGVAGYSFLKFGLDETLAMMRRIDVHYLCIKDFHLPLNSSPETIAAFQSKLKAADVTGYAVGPVNMKTREAIDQAFDYARRVGVDLMVGIPDAEGLPYINQKVNEYGIRYAIHNHGAGDKVFPDGSTVFNHIKNLDPRVGLCLDIGHDTRFGSDPIAETHKYHKRIFDVHLKNVTSANGDGKTIELGRGVINIPDFVKALRKVRYTGVCALEFEKDRNDPLAGVAESIGYFRGVLDASR